MDGRFLLDKGPQRNFTITKMKFLYDIGIKAFFYGVFIASKLNFNKAKQWLNGRKGLFKNLQIGLGGGSVDIWFHCASMGEFEQARPLIEHYKSSYPDHFVLVSFFSPSAYLHHNNYKFADYVFYLPLDTRKNAKKLLQIMDVKRVVFVKYEFWFNLLHALEKRNISVYLVSGIFRKSQQFFKFYGRWFRNKLSAFKFFYVQNEESIALLNSIGYKNAMISGDSRFDRVVKIKEEVFKNAELDAFCNNSKTIVFGSAWKQECDYAIQLLNETAKFKVIIAPHEIDSNFCKDLLSKTIRKGILWSNVKDLSDIDNTQLLIIDKIGLLSRLYRYADFAFIGGGYGKGIHNILEAAVYGCPIFFGKNYNIFQEAHDLVSQNSAFPVENYQEFNAILDRLMNDTKELSLIRESTIQYVKKNTGVASKIFSHMINQG